jgi:hypothetical protein
MIEMFILHVNQYVVGSAHELCMMIEAVQRYSKVY